MYISDQIVYLALHKTGCSHVLKLLQNVPDLGGIEIGKHNTIYEVPKAALGNFVSKIKCGNIRNPWDWYVSLWAFGCMKKGALYEQIINRNIFKKIAHPSSFLTPVSQWRNVYANVDDPALFREWLYMLLQTRRRDITHFGNAKVSPNIGLLTYRYLHLYNFHFEKNIASVKNQDDVAGYDLANNFINHFIRNENLEADFKLLMQKSGVKNEALERAMDIPKTNTSKRKSYPAYYDDISCKLVAAQEQYIIQKHGYQFD